MGMPLEQLRAYFGDLPADLDEWRKSVRPPVELYFVFKRRRDQGRYVRMMSREFPETEVIV